MRKYKNRILLILFFLVGIIGFARQVQAVNCGDVAPQDGVTDTPCNCGDTVVGQAGYTYELPGNLGPCPGDGLAVGSNSITIDGGGYTISGTGFSGSSGIRDSAGRDSITVQNINITNFTAGIRLINSDSSTIKNNTITLCHWGVYNLTSNGTIFNNNTISSTYAGIYMQTSSSLAIGQAGGKGNTIKLNSYGLYFNMASSNTITENILFNNMQDIYSSSSNTFSDNTLNYNINSKMLSMTDSSRVKNVGDTISFDVSTLTLAGAECTNCLSAVVYPSEMITQDNDWSSTSNPQGHFTANKSGIYSLNFTITDPSSNIARKTMLFFVGDTDSQSVRYYLRSTLPTHGQPRNASGANDSGSFLFSPATSVETRNCTSFVQNSIDEIPDYPFANLSSISLNYWYRMAPPLDAYIGIQRYVTYDGGYAEIKVDFSNSIDNFSPVDYTWTREEQYPSGINFTDLNWGMDLPSSWYVLTIKLAGTGPYAASFPSLDYQDQPSYAELTYQYTTTPAVKSISNPEVIVLSATEPEDEPGNATIVLDGTGASDTSVDVVLDNYNRPFFGYTTTINSNGTATLQATDIDTETTINSVNMEVTPDSGSVDILVAIWNTTGNCYRVWTETASAEGIMAKHIIRDLAPDNYYSVTKDGTLLGLYLSDGSGRITFSSPAGSVFAVSGLNTVFQTDGDGGGGEETVSCFIATAAYGTPMAGEVRTLSRFRDECLLTNPMGKVFVSAYYKVSPPIADFIGAHPMLRNIVRQTLRPLIWMSEKLIE